MKKIELYRVCLKSSNFEDIPTFRIKIGKTQKKISPYFIPSDKQRYNCDSILQRSNQQPEIILSVFFAYKFIGSGSIKFDKSDMPNEHVQIFNRDHQKISVVDCSFIKISKVVQVPALDITIKSIKIKDLGPKDINGSPFLVLKYGELNYQTEKQAVYDSDDNYIFNEAFKFPQSEMERVIGQIWCDINNAKTFVGVCLLYLRQKDDINKEIITDISYMSKKRGQVVLSIYEDKKKEAKLKDYSNAPKRTIKTTLIEAVLINQPINGAYVKLKVDKQTFQSTPIFNDAKELRWNQSFTMQVNSQKQELVALLCIKDKEEEVLGRAFLQISKIANRTYQLTLLNEKECDYGKVYLEFYDHELNIKDRKTISKELADKIGADLQAIKNRYRPKQPLHQYLETLNAVLSQGLIMVSRKKPANPLKELGEFLLAYRRG